MEDTDLMTFGKYKNQEMQNVPAKYLLWLFDEGKVYGSIRKYIIDNKDVLEKEAGL